MGEQRAVKKIPVVVYAPKYDNELREEYDVEILPNGKFRVTTTRVARKNVTDEVGVYDSYDEAREVMFDKFNQDFNRPSENAIKSAGRSPAERVWDSTSGGRDVKASISMTEGSRDFQVVGYGPKTVTIKIKREGPFILSVKDIHPKFFSNLGKMHSKRIGRLQGYRRAKK